MALHRMATRKFAFTALPGCVLMLAAWSSAQAQSPIPPLIGPLQPPAEAPPAPQQALRERYAVLSGEVEQGNPVAMCELAAALDACAVYAERLDALHHYLQIVERAARASAYPQAAASMASNNADVRSRQEPQLIAWAASCAGVPAYSAGQRLELWHNAAKAGNWTALTRYVRAAALSHQALKDVSPDTAADRADVEALALEASRRGSLAAAATLASAYAPDNEQAARHPIAQAVQPDPVKALALAERVLQALPQTHEHWLRRGLANLRVERLRAGMSPSQIERSQVLARQWQRRWAPMDISPAGLADFWPASEAVALADTDCTR